MPARCRALKEEARSAALVLELPSLQVQALRAPNFTDLTGVNPIPRDGLQARAAIGWSAIDLLRGRSTRSLADAECERWIAQQELEEILRQGTSYGRADALAAELAALTAARPRVTQLVDEAKEALAREIVTVLERDELVLRQMRLELRVEELRHERVLLLAQGEALDAQGLGAALARYERATLASEDERAQQRRLAAWNVNLQAGATPYPERDWYGMMSVGYSLGGFGQGAAERAARSAREDALATGPDELRRRVTTFTRAMRDSAVTLADELALLDRQIALQRERLEAPASTERLRQVLALAEIDGLELGARRAYVARLHAARAAAGSSLE